MAQPKRSITERASRSSDGQAFCPLTTAPFLAGSTQTRTLGTPSTVIRQLGHRPATQVRPRGRWYLNDLLNMRTPAA